MGEVLKEDGIHLDPEVSIEGYDNLWIGRSSPAAQHERKMTHIIQTDEIIVDFEEDEVYRR